MPSSTVRALFAALVALCSAVSTAGPYPSHAAFAWSARGFQRPSPAQLKAKLTPLQYGVTQEDDTEPPFRNTYWNNHAAGIYVDVVSGEPLFSSFDKYDSGTGWPSFTRPLVKENVTTREDRKLLSVRTEARSKHADSHLGHVFDDGPAPTGQRWCMNSAALRFVAAADLAKEGYGEFAALFTPDKTAVVEARALFSGGCFWCMEPPFEKMKGVKAVVSGYTGGAKPNPTYEEVSTNVTGHVETVEVVYDPNLVNYDALLETFWRQVDPTDAGGQFVDRGSSYRPVIWYANEKERAAAQSSKDALARSGRFKKPLTIEILPAKPFYAAEEYHQDYYRKNAIRYKYYRYRSGRDRFLDATWGSDRAK